MTAFAEMNPIRLRNYRTYMDDGRSYAEYRHDKKDKVFVAIIVGEEPKVLKSQEDLCDIDSVILAMAEHIKSQRAPKKKAVKKKVPKKKVKKKIAARKKKTKKKI